MKNNKKEVNCAFKTTIENSIFDFQQWQIMW